jgi:choline kinase
VTDTALILAAGRGSRLLTLGEERPKGLIRLGSLPIIEESIQRLHRAGVTRIVIVTGHRERCYRELAARLGGSIFLVHNPCFAESGSAYSMHCARELVGDRDFLLLESDITYEQRALQEVLADDASGVILCSGPTGSGDEVYVEANAGHLIALSKRRSELGTGVIGELVGITRVSPGLFRAMVSAAEEHFRQSLHMEYEQTLVAASRHCAVRCRVVGDLLWAEIDDASHLERATLSIYPAIVRRDGMVQ